MNALQLKTASPVFGSIPFKAGDSGPFYGAYVTLPEVKLVPGTNHAKVNATNAAIFLPDEFQLWKNDVVLRGKKYQIDNDIETTSRLSYRSKENILAIAAEQGDDLAVVSAIPEFLLGLPCISQILGMKVSEDDTHVSAYINICNSTFRVPQFPEETYASIVKGGVFKLFSYFDIGNLKSIIPTRKTGELDDKYAITGTKTAGRAALIATQASYAGPFQKALIFCASIFQDIHLGTVKLDQPKYLDRFLGGSGAEMPWEHPLSYVSYLSAYRGSRYLRLIALVITEALQRFYRLKEGKDLGPMLVLDHVNGEAKYLSQIQRSNLAVFPGDNSALPYGIAKPYVDGGALLADPDVNQVELSAVVSRLRDDKSLITQSDIFTILEKHQLMQSLLQSTKSVMESQIELKEKQNEARENSSVFGTPEILEFVSKGRFPPSLLAKGRINENVDVFSKLLVFPKLTVTLMEEYLRTRKEVDPFIAIVCESRKVYDPARVLSLLPFDKGVYNPKLLTLVSNASREAKFRINQNDRYEWAVLTLDKLRLGHTFGFDRSFISDDEIIEREIIEKLNENSKTMIIVMTNDSSNLRRILKKVPYARIYRISALDFFTRTRHQLKECGHGDVLECFQFGIGKFESRRNLPPNLTSFFTKILKRDGENHHVSAHIDWGSLDANYSRMYEVGAKDTHSMKIKVVEHIPLFLNREHNRGSSTRRVRECLQLSKSALEHNYNWGSNRIMELRTHNVDSFSARAAHSQNVNML